MSKLTTKQFVQKWGQTPMLPFSEMQSAQTHFNDICDLVGHPDPIAFADKTIFCFETNAIKPDGRKGRADVFYRNRFVWEYKGLHANLDKAYQQLLFYKDALGNPPLLITSDTQRIIIHTNYTNTIKETHVITLEDIAHGDGLSKLETIFKGDIDKTFKPDKTREQITEATAQNFIKVVESFETWVQKQTDQTEFAHEKQAHFFIRLLFCLFSESIGLLPDKLFTKTMQNAKDMKGLRKRLQGLFHVMRNGGLFGMYEIRNFDGGLFNDDFVPPHLHGDMIMKLLDACRYDWSQLEPSVFGTLFERILDTTKRHQIGAHYTGKTDIELIVEPVLMQPLRDEWQTVRMQSMSLIRNGDKEKAHAKLQTLADKIADTQVLDPACGSGNFLYVALKRLLDLQKEVIVFAQRHELADIPLTVDPKQLHGMEINEYAHELAQVTVWIGYIQWRFESGFEKLGDPIMQPLNTIKRMDAILAYDEHGKPYEPTWQSADVIISNPPFLGGKRLRKEFGDVYVNDIFGLYNDIIPRESDLVCYWFEKARAMIEHGNLKRAGLLATNSIDGGANRKVLDRIKKTGDIFMAWRDKKWELEGAAVFVSIVCFDDGKETERFLDGQSVNKINSDLTTFANLTVAKQLLENANIAFMGDTKVGAFEIESVTAQQFLIDTSNTNQQPNSDVVRPWINGLDITRRRRNMWIIDFGVGMPIEEASQYILPFQYVTNHVKSYREVARSGNRTGVSWWIHQRPRPAMRKALELLTRFIVTSSVSKHRIFVWVKHPTLPGHALYVIASQNDYFFGVLHSKLHEVWALQQGTALGITPRYTSTTTFETFPFPYPPGTEPSETDSPIVESIAEHARELVEFRQSWLHPTDTLIGKLAIKKRTLTNLYNALNYYREHVKGKHRDESKWFANINKVVKLGKASPKYFITLSDIETLDWIHMQLDHAVLDAYGWEHSLTDEQILENLLTLNLARAEK